MVPAVKSVDMLEAFKGCPSCCVCGPHVRVCTSCVNRCGNSLVALLPPVPLLPVTPLSPDIPTRPSASVKMCGDTLYSLVAFLPQSQLPVHAASPAVHPPLRRDSHRVAPTTSNLRHHRGRDRKRRRRPRGRCVIRGGRTW